MKTYLVTGAAGFIGANYIKYLLHKKYVNEDIKIIVLDALTYAGNLGTIKDDIDNKRCVFVKGDTRQTLWGLFGGLLFWTGWVEFLFMYYARRYGVQPEIEYGKTVTQPEYLILPASFGMWMMTMVMYVFSTKNGCLFITWVQKVCFRSQRKAIVVQPMTRHTSIVTFMETNMMLWASYLLLMFCYDKNFFGDHHPVTFLVGLGCLVGSLFMLERQLHIASWGANIRMAVATVIVFWVPVEILGRINFFKEFWVEPEKYALPMLIILTAFAVLGVYLWRKGQVKR